MLPRVPPLTTVLVAGLTVAALAACVPAEDTDTGSQDEAPAAEASQGSEARPAPTGGDVPTPDRADVASMDAILAAVYDVISGPAGEARDWDRFRSLFIPEARLVAVGRSEAGDVQRTVMTPEQYIEGSGPYLEENGFFESEIGRTAEEYRHIAHVFSAYESRREPEAEPFARGVNSFQLLDDGERWWVVTILWNAETEEEPIPERYLR